MPICPTCNSLVDATDRFCTACGTALSVQPPATPTQQPAAPRPPAARQLPPPCKAPLWPPQNGMPYPDATPMPMGWPLLPVATAPGLPDEQLFLQGRGVWVKGENDFSNGQFYLTNYRAVFYELPASVTAMYGPYVTPAHALPRQSGYLEIPLGDVGAAEETRQRGSGFLRLGLPGGFVDFWLEPVSYWVDAVACMTEAFRAGEAPPPAQENPTEPQPPAHTPTAEDTPAQPVAAWPEHLTHEGEDE